MKFKLISNIRPIIMLMALSLAFWNCGAPANKDNASPERETEKPVLVVTVLPQQYFVQRIAGDGYHVEVMIPPGQSPHTYEPSPQQMKAVSRGKIYFLSGQLPFETSWREKLTSINHLMIVKDTSAGVTWIKETDPHQQPESREVHSGEAEHRGHADHTHQEDAHPASASGHHHGGYNPHQWLSPTEVKIQAGHIKDALSAMNPTQKEMFHRNYTSFIQDLDILGTELQEVLAPVKGRKFFVYHPAFTYLARDYGMTEISIEMDGKSPGVSGMKKIIDQGRALGITAIFVQQQFSTANAEAVAAEIGARVIPLDPLSADWLNNMRHMARTFRDTLSPFPHSTPAKR